MGAIYSNAKLVIAWLGPHHVSGTNLVSSLRDRLSQYNSPNPAILGNLKLRASRARLQSPTSTDTDPHIRFLYATSLYWSRAWIMQKLAVAHRVLLLSGEEELDLNAVVWSEDLVNAIKAEFGLPGRDIIQSPVYGIWKLATDARWRVYIDAAMGLNVPHHQTPSLLTLLSRFRSKQCFHKRDRIHSLKYLCQEGWVLDIDYDSSAFVLLYHIIQISSQSICLCSALALTKALHDMNRLEQIFLELQDRFVSRHSPDAQFCTTCGVELDLSFECEVMCLRKLCSTVSDQLWRWTRSPDDLTVMYRGAVSSYSSVGTVSAGSPVGPNGQCSRVVRLSMWGLVLY
jgi:hypothetical protein